jgi:hypothetical protein
MTFAFPRRFINMPAYHRTGGIASRDAAYAACSDHTHRADNVSRCIDLGGPLDAPEVMPAGSCESRLWTNYRGEAMPHVSELRREA